MNLMMMAGLVAVQVLQADSVPKPDGPTYARPQMLVEAKQLDTGKARANYHLLDIRGEKLFTESHIPGSVLAPKAIWSESMRKGKADETFWRTQLSQLGITPNKPVVIIGDDIKEAARVWWLLRFAGVADVRLLHGGWRAYQDLGVTTESGSVTPTPAPAYAWRIRAEVQAHKSEILDKLAAKYDIVQILDARSLNEFRGTVKLSERGGHIPQAIRLEWSELLEPKSQRFLPAEKLRDLLQSRKIDLGQPCLTYCQTGGRAAVVAFALELMGADRVQNYYRSWSEWGNDPDTPISQGEGNP